MSALSAAESRAELLRQMFRHARRALRADVLAVALLEPGGSHLAVVDNRGGPEQPGQRLPLRSPVPMAAAAAGRPIFQGDAGENGSAAPLPGLRALDRALSETGIATLATAVVARVEEPPVPTPDCARVLRWSNAGHPPPLLLGPDGTASLLERPANVLLGVAPDTPRRHHSVALPPGATVVLYTDGLVEHRDATLDDGLDRLLAVASDLAAHPVSELCDEILDRMAPDLTDDIALLAVRVREEGPPDA